MKRSSRKWIPGVPKILLSDLSNVYYLVLEIILLGDLLQFNREKWMVLEIILLCDLSSVYWVVLEIILLGDLLQFNT